MKPRFLNMHLCLNLCVLRCACCDNLWESSLLPCGSQGWNSGPEALWRLGSRSHCLQLLLGGCPQGNTGQVQAQHCGDASLGRERLDAAAWMGTCPWSPPLIFHKPSTSSFLAHSCGAAGLAWADLRGSDSQVPASSAVIRTCCAASGPLCPVKGGLGWCPPLHCCFFPPVQVFGAQEALISTGSTSCPPSCCSQPAPPCLPPFPHACRPEPTGRLRPCSGHRPGQTAEPQYVLAS